MGKECVKCRETKPLSEFHKDPTGKYGVRSRCKACRSDRAPEVDTIPVPRVEVPLEVGMIIPDCHVPNHDTRAFSLMLKVGAFLKPKHLVILGDFADAESLSAHPPTKPGEEDFSRELAEVNQALDHLDALGATNKVYIEGNHEFRLQRYIMERAPGLFRMLGWRECLRLHERDWSWVPYRKSTNIGKVHFTHDTGTAGMNAHRVSAQTFGGSAVIGHTHRMSFEVRGRFEGTPYLAAMFGWLGDAEKAASYMHEAKAADWVHGFGVFHLEPYSGVVHVQPVPIVNGKCVVHGRLFT